MLCCEQCQNHIGPFRVLCEACEVQAVQKPARLRAKLIDDLELSVRANNCLHSLGIETVGELIQWSAADLCRCPSLGFRTKNEIMDMLASLGLQLREAKP